MDYNQDYNRYLERFNCVLNSYISKLDKETPEIIRESISYSVLNGGKRIRPVLCYVVADMLGVELDAVDNYALAIELIHSYSLVHDDLPAMDNDDYRRGQLSTHKKFGEAFGILAGDALLNLAFEVCLDKENFSTNDLKACRIIADFAGYRGMIAGQVLDLLAEKKYFSNCTIEEREDLLKKIYVNKTSKLLTLPLLVASELSGGKFHDELNELGINIGIMFQITDDIFDVEADFETIGKTPNKDVNKLTAVNLYGLNKAKEHAFLCYNRCKEILNTMPNSNFLQQFTDKIFFRKK